MSQIESLASIPAVGIVSGAVVVALLDRLVEKRILSDTDAREVLAAAANAIEGRQKNVLRDECAGMITALQMNFPKRDV